MPKFLTFLKYFSVFNYGYDALMINQWEGPAVNFTCQIDPFKPSVCITNGQEILDDIDLVPSEKSTFIWLLFVLMIIYRLITYAILKYKLKLRQFDFYKDLMNIEVKISVKRKTAQSDDEDDEENVVRNGQVNIAMNDRGRIEF
jgi:hypothetical protein